VFCIFPIHFAQKNTVVLPLAESGFRHALDAHQGIPGRKLVRKIFVDLRGERTVHQGFPGKLREGGQTAVFFFGKIRVGHDHKGNGKGKNDRSKQHGGGYIDDLVEFHMYTLLLRK
jgi:hypothetical protein